MRKTMSLALGALTALSLHCIDVIDDSPSVDNPCFGVTCTDKGTCVDIGSVASCDCDLGYRAQDLDCVLEANPCSGVTCSTYGTCVLRGGNATCSCDSGYEAQGLSCISVTSPCDGVTCSDHGRCQLSDGSASCDCDPGYQAQGLSCVSTANPCDGVACSGFGTCEVSNGAATCRCDAGYRAEGLSCRPAANPCDGVTCSGEGTCQVLDGNPTCQCNSGYRPRGLTCVAGGHPKFGVNMGYLYDLTTAGGTFRSGYDWRSYRTSQGAAPAGALNPDMLDALRPFSVIRFMQTHQTNCSVQVAWSDRFQRIRDDEEAGLPYEWEIQICNEANTDCWFTLPHQASDDYFRELARLVRRDLHPDLNAYVEYSNEVWNGAFASPSEWCPQSGQHTYAASNGRQSFGLDNASQAAAYWTVHRSFALFSAFTEELGDQAHRLRRVIAWNTPEDTPEFNWNPLEPLIRAIGDARVSGNGALPTTIDLLAVHTYFGHEVQDATPNRWNALDASLTAAERNFRYARRVLDDAGLGSVQLAAYEGGQHMDFSMEMNASPNIYSRYQRWMDISNATMDLSMHYHLAGTCGVYNGTCFPLKRTFTQPNATAHKYRAMVDWMQAHP